LFTGWRKVLSDIALAEIMDPYRLGLLLLLLAVISVCCFVKLIIL